MNTRASTASSFSEVNEKMPTYDEGRLIEIKRALARTAFWICSLELASSEGALLPDFDIHWPNSVSAAMA